MANKFERLFSARFEVSCQLEKEASLLGARVPIMTPPLDGVEVLLAYSSSFPHDVMRSGTETTTTNANNSVSTTTIIMIIMVTVVRVAVI